MVSRLLHNVTLLRLSGVCILLECVYDGSWLSVGCIGVPAPDLVISPAKAPAHGAQAVKEDLPAPQQKEDVQPRPVAKAAGAAPKQPPAPAAANDDDEDLEISDEEGLAAEGDGSEVDEDWGGDWE